jgi:antitoxin CptB
MSPSGVSGALPDADLEMLRRRLRFRSHHRGSKELDLILGSFADRHLDGLDRRQLEGYQALLEATDPDLYDWLTGAAPAPPDHDHDVLRLIQHFRIFKPSH